jgi:Protein of unknown function (DUF4242)
MAISGMLAQSVGPMAYPASSPTQFVAQDEIYCIYVSPTVEVVREHARQGAFPANRVSEVKLVIDPTSTED